MKNYQGKLFSILGDSISTFEGVTPEGYNVFYTAARKCEANVIPVEETWWGRVIAELGGELLANDSWSGSLVCKHPQCEIESYGASDARTSALGKDGKTPDVVMVYIGTNDWGWNMTINPKPGREEDLSVFRVAYNAMLRKIRKNYPAAEIWCFTLAVSDSMRDFEFTLPFVSGKRASMVEYCRAICDCARENGCRIINLYQPAHAYATIDDLHPDRRGMKTIAEMVLRQLEAPEQA